MREAPTGQNSAPLAPVLAGFPKSGRGAACLPCYCVNDV
ncbi:MAG: hypothetical protein LZF62_480317 [Nitrospira sp.]|nr:MAG: hypothetical protein LZF62_480317 [Nitrospira sp.]